MFLFKPMYTINKSLKDAYSVRSEAAMMAGWADRWTSYGNTRRSRFWHVRKVSRIMFRKLLRSRSCCLRLTLNPYPFLSASVSFSLPLRVRTVFVSQGMGGDSDLVSVSLSCTMPTFISPFIYIPNMYRT